MFGLLRWGRIASLDCFTTGVNSTSSRDGSTTQPTLYSSSTSSKSASLTFSPLRLSWRLVLLLAYRNETESGADKQVIAAPDVRAESLRPRPGDSIRSRLLFALLPHSNFPPWNPQYAHSLPPSFLLRGSFLILLLYSPSRTLHHALRPPLRHLHLHLHGTSRRVTRPRPRSPRRVPSPRELVPRLPARHVPPSQGVPPRMLRLLPLHHLHFPLHPGQPTAPRSSHRQSSFAPPPPRATTSRLPRVLLPRFFPSPLIQPSPNAPTSVPSTDGGSNL